MLRGRTLGAERADAQVYGKPIKEPSPNTQIAAAARRRFETWTETRHNFGKLCEFSALLRRETAFVYALLTANIYQRINRHVPAPFLAT